MKFVDVVVLLYAILTIVMGVLGYVAPTTGHPSIASLIAGVGIGALLLGALALTKTNPRAGRIGAAVLTLVPLGRFLPTFISKQNWYPAGIMTIAGIFTFGVLLGGHFIAMSQRKKETSA
ncbi:TMEM14 family protein [Fimbriimonas ginsengisoli]|uniref:Integral membrane protein n=1 Tax=Fimbriimonas ginsengisoli Gsoil 348 TaxID=661478 RepID=A0A068NWU7_FIMGI|nr:TMEM14 family protein [Fimbriimonas ginsengisoli]AIE87847.1 hypothetical protein OP10G_4479 [Fimbriimonas ginsengisoli Gsoil 348]